MPSGWTKTAAESAVENGSRNVEGAEAHLTSALPTVRSCYVPPHLRNKLRGLGADNHVVAISRASVGVVRVPDMPVAPNVGAIPGASYFTTTTARSIPSSESWSKCKISLESRGDNPTDGRSSGRSSGSQRSVSESGTDPDPFSKDKPVNLFDKENTGIKFDAYEDIPVEVSGENIPPPADTFAEIDLGDTLNENIRRCKYVKPTPVQRYAIPISLSGRDLMACAQTGSGKTAAFCFPIIAGIMRCSPPQRPCGGRKAFPLALILAPTRELSSQISKEAKRFSFQTGLRVVVAYGGAPLHDQLRDLEQGGEILVATPGRLVDFLKRGRVALSAIKYLVLDEADQMLDKTFEHQIREIVEHMDMPPASQRQTMLFSASFPREIQRLASEFLSNYIFLAVGRVGYSTDLIEHRVEYVRDGEKRSVLMDLLQVHISQSSSNQHYLTLIFVDTKHGADALENWLCSMGFPATSIHGDRTQSDRDHALRSFQDGVTPILVVTDVAARGLDIPHVDQVVNFELPKDINDYAQRMGHTGQAGKSGIATAFFNEKSMRLARPLEELMQKANQEIPGWLATFALRAKSAGGKNHHSGRCARCEVRDFRSEDTTVSLGVMVELDGNAGKGWGFSKT